MPVFFSCSHLLARVLCVDDCNNTLDDFSNSELLVLSSAQTMDAIDVLQCFARLHEGAKQALHALAEFESHSQPLMRGNTKTGIMDYSRN